MNYKPPKGTDDIFPPESRVWGRCLRTFEEVAERFGYELVMTPLLESTDLFVRGVGQATEVVEKQMYTFLDKKNRSLTLRPEATASTIRALLDRGGVAGVFKGYYSGAMFRYERPQAGRRRQFYQVGVEYVGEPSPLADVEVIEVGYRLLEALGVPDVEVRLNSIGDPADRIAYRAELIGFLELRKDELSADAANRIADNPLRVLDSKADTAVVADAPRPIDALGSDAKAHLAGVKDGLELLAIPYAIDPLLVRGLDYYNRTVFEYVPLAFDIAQNSVGGGGRYDQLAETLGGKPMAGVGLSMGIDRIILAMGEQPTAQTLDVYVVLADESLHDEVTALVSRLRGQGLRVDTDLAGRSVSAQFKQADRRSAAKAVVIGDEWAEGNVKARDLETGEQTMIAVEEIGTWALNR